MKSLLSISWFKSVKFSAQTLLKVKITAKDNKQINKIFTFIYLFLFLTYKKLMVCVN